MKKSIIVYLHFLYWGPRFIMLIIYLATNRESGSINPAFYLNVANLVPSFICFYTFYLYLFPAFLAKKRIPLFVLSGLVVWVILSSIALITLKSAEIEMISGKISLIFWMMSITPSVLLSGVIGSLFKGFQTWYSEIRLKEQLVRKNMQTELALLKAQINPHFLFNTINNIDVLIEKDPQTASRYLKQLSEMMRFMLYETSSDFIPVTTELDYIMKYIELQKIRTANDRFVNISISVKNENMKIAPAILIPFIENAFKHSTNKKIEDAINISVEITGNGLSFNCKNYFDSSRSFTQERSGLGIDLIRQRLKLIYNEKHQLDIAKSENQFEVNLKILN